MGSELLWIEGYLVFFDHISGIALEQNKETIRTKKSNPVRVAKVGSTVWWGTL